MHKFFIPFHWKLFISIMALFLAFAASFLTFQYEREKRYKAELLNQQLQDYNNRLYEFLYPYKDSLACSDVAPLLDRYIEQHHINELRATIITSDGTVVYDSGKEDIHGMDNHLKRAEIQAALKDGTGFDINRQSRSTGLAYFYSAHYYDNKFIIRSALPYDVNLIKNLKADQHFVWFTILSTLLLTVVFFTFTKRLGMSIRQLRNFAFRADRNEPISAGVQSFPHNELGEISQHIIQIYKRLHQTKEALYIEREKLITHLQISREGLGIFDANKREILVNNLFTQYSNIISDQNLETTEAVFAIPELKDITRFINNSRQRPEGGQEEKRKAITICKDGRIFNVECIIFQDESFEISINDISQEEEQARLKRQLTQNIAHELKTPVSSIQGYLETIVNAENLPPEKQKTFLERCYAQSNRLACLLRDISVLTRMDEAPHLIDMETVDIAAIIHRIANETALDLEEKHITLINMVPEKLEVKGNASLIYSIFRNLTDNAIAYAGTNININIKCFREDENYYYFSFADTGTGVAPEHLNRLFERFYRVDKGRSRKIGGTGLGLAIVKNAVILHGGNISAKNNQDGGLEFIFTLAKQ